MLKISIKTNTYVFIDSALLCAASAYAAEFPARPVRLIVPFAPGATEN